jgi:hypothetical protein
MITVLSILTVVFYILGGIFFTLVTGLEPNKTEDLLKIIFYPLTMWFIK